MVQDKDINILIVDDEADIRSLIRGILEDDGYNVSDAANSDQAYEVISQNQPSLIILDIWLQNSAQDGIDILKSVRKNHPYVPVIMISGHGTVETAVSSIKLGAYDFIEKPFKSDRLLLMIKRALETSALQQENTSLKQMATQKSDVSLTGNSPTIQAIRQLIERVAPTNSRVLISGEPGSGKETAARLLHKLSPRNSWQMIIMNCSAMTMQPCLIEEELFGIEKDGNIKTGLLERANGGTLLFDEISDIPLETQAKILRLLQEQSFRRVNGEEDIKVDVRFFASTNRNLETLMTQGTFRKDLFHRLNVVPLRMPRLKDRLQDIPDLVKTFSKEIETQSGLSSKTFSPKLMSALQSCEWPGNVRQLKNAVEWMMIMSGPEEKRIGGKFLPPNLEQVHASGTGERNNNASISAHNIRIMPEVLSKPLREAREEFERHYLLSQIKKFEGNVSRTAKFVGMERSALHRKLKLLQVTNHHTAPEEDSSEADTGSSTSNQERSA